MDRMEAARVRQLALVEIAAQWKMEGNHASIDRLNEALRILSEPVDRTEVIYDKDFGDDKLCACSHPYRRHFDTYDEMRAVGCKYCQCSYFHGIVEGSGE
jgi:hypothetical protein